jgi:hypothetical protein
VVTSQRYIITWPGLIPIDVLTLFILEHNILTYLHYVEIWPGLSLLMQAFGVLDRS